jgi:2-C-methyl-D-erythritol 4-phosphate cytidylyltransferase
MALRPQDTIGSIGAKPQRPWDTIDLVFLCAGRGTRVGLDLPKQFVDLHGQPLMTYALLAYEKLPFVGKKIIVHDPCDRDRVERILQQHGISRTLLVAGGATRQESVRAGLDQVETVRILTHNAAVPFVTGEMVERVLAEKADCVTTVTEVQDNLVRFEKNTLLPVSRHGLQIINSPQSFHAARFRDAHQRGKAEGKQFNSDAELMLHYGYSLSLVPGPAWSFKVTDRVDLALAETILNRVDLFPALTSNPTPP